jgi:hypothetical protein
MKPILKQFVQALFLIFLLFASCYFPGSEKDNIRFMTLAYARRSMTDGQTVRFGGIEQKKPLYVEGECRLYIETYFYLTSPSGVKEKKYLYLLMSEDCDSLIDFTGVKGVKPWCPLKPDAQRTDSSVDKFIREACRELGIPNQ